MMLPVGCRVEIRAAFVAANDLRASAGREGWTKSVTDRDYGGELRAAVVSHIAVPEYIQQQGWGTKIVEALETGEAGDDLVVVEMVGNPHLRRVLNRRGWKHDPGVNDFYWPKTPAGTDAVERHLARVNAPTPVLPRALQEHELTDADVDLMLKIAADKDAPSGRLKRPGKNIPSVQHADDPADPKRVVNVLLLTDVCMKPGSSTDQDIAGVEAAVAGWTPEERKAAAEWAWLSHLKAGDNDVAVPPCPPHVKKLRPDYGARKQGG